MKSHSLKTVLIMVFKVFFKKKPIGYMKKIQKEIFKSEI